MSKLKRTNDNKKWKFEEYTFIEWEGEIVKALHREIGLGYSLMLEPQRNSFKWHTTPILEFSEEGGVITFDTEKSTYLLKL